MAEDGRSGASPPSRIGIVGFGRMAELFHWPGLRAAGWRIEAVLDVTESRRARALELGAPRAVSTMRELLETDLDAALIATHSSLRRAVIAPLARAGLHILVEKPLAMTGREARSICDLCDRQGVLLSVYHNRRFDPDALRVRELVESGAIGHAFHVENRLFARGPATSFGAADFNQKWRETAALGGGTMLDWGVHLMDQSLALMKSSGPIVSVAGDTRNIRFGDADDHFLISLTFANGDRALVGKSDVCPAGPAHKWLIIGGRGSIVADWERATSCSYDDGERVIEAVSAAPSLHANFRDAIEAGARLLVTGRESLRSARVFDAARRSARRGGRTVGVCIP